MPRRADSVSTGLPMAGSEAGAEADPESLEGGPATSQGPKHSGPDILVRLGRLELPHPAPEAGALSTELQAPVLATGPLYYLPALLRKALDLARRPVLQPTRDAPAGAPP